MPRDYESCAAVAAKFTTKRDFRKYADGEYQWLRRNGLYDIACAHLERLRRNITNEEIAGAAKLFGNRRAFRDADQSLYQAARKRGILDAVCAHMVTKKRQMSDDQIANIAAQYQSRGDLVRGDNGAYQAAKKRGILDSVCDHMDGKGDRRLTDAEILDIAKQFATRNDFKLGDFGAYTTAIRRGLIEDAVAHMEYGACGFREDRPAVLYQFRVETAAGLVLYKVGITNRKPRQRLATMGIERGAKSELINCVKFDSGRDARLAEKRLHRKLSKHRYAGPPVMKNGNTELFTVSVFEP